MPSASLAEKMKLKPGSSAALLNAPEGYLTELAPERVTFDHVLDGEYDWIQIFVKNQAELAEWLPKVQAALKPISLLWITFPKSASKIQTDLTRDTGWDAVTGLKWVHLISVNAHWSAFSLRPYKEGEARRSFR